MINEGILLADSIFFDNAALNLENHEKAEIRMDQKIVKEVKKITNRGSFLSENSFISLFYETFINRRTVETLSGTFFKGDFLRNHSELRL